MNPRQRRGVILMALAVVGGVAVFIAVANFVAEVSTQVGPEVTALVLADGLGAYEPLAEERLSSVSLPRRWLPEGALTDEGQVTGLVASTDLPAGTLLQRGMLVPPPILETGQREIAIMVDAETGVAGKIGPGSRVDVYATFGSTNPFGAAESGSTRPEAVLVVQNALVLDVGTPRPVEDPEGFEVPFEVSSGGPVGQAVGGVFGQTGVPITFALSIEESLQLSYVESFATKVRLALRAPGDFDDVPASQRRFDPFPRSGP